MTRPTATPQSAGTIEDRVNAKMAALSDALLAKRTTPAQQTMRKARIAKQALRPNDPHYATHKLALRLLVQRARCEHRHHFDAQGICVRCQAVEHDLNTDRTW